MGGLRDQRKKLNKELTDVLSQITKQHGKGSIFELGTSERLAVEVIPSGSLAIDVALGVGGFPRGRIVEIFGPASGGKTTLTLHAIAQAQKMGEVCAFLDSEHALDPTYAHRLGVDTEKLLVSQPDCGEQTLEIAESLIKSNQVGMVVIDSVATLVPRAELEGEMGAPQMGLQARLMSSALRKLTAVTAKSKTCLIFINQIREKLGVMFGSPEVTTGGRALQFYASIRVDIRRVKTNSEDDVKVSNTTKVKIVKNKLSPPFREAEVEIVFGEGISRELDLVNFGVEKSLLSRAGMWYDFGGQRFQGIENLKSFLRENLTVADDLEAKLRKILFAREA